MKKLSVSLVFLALLISGCSTTATGSKTSPSSEEIANFQAASAVVSTITTQSTSGVAGSILKSISTKDIAPTTFTYTINETTNGGDGGTATISGTYIVNTMTLDFTVEASISFNNFKSSSTNEALNGSVTVSETGTMTMGSSSYSYDITATQKANLTYGEEALDWEMVVSLKMNNTSVLYTYNGTINGKSYTGTVSGTMSSL